MSRLQKNPNTFTSFRLVYAIIFLVIGFSFAIIGMLISNHPEMVTWLPYIRPEAGLPLVFSGVISVAFGIGALHLILNRRMDKSERRQHQMPIGFADRRSGHERRYHDES
ncbi:hypothetical protein BOW53_09835 [Solemya pervernicosa gill symbiont]|uniref:Uncharacterized protein n=2 Tax=Gammaproteobacteria incertae sedis TaxID=118884 RepID=A0A1T2L497_9GAMM|nr:hypothetical protein [Candidatus Reidiella endopervernicosa]OOZ39894.1 hypothetical protein BOW53_09835 [Solemya pervernicosa gill symbiont]QKQ25782.1 hypothetical protein HUE57_05430 [Candidatus Reidiella endopervernicosa]